MESEQSGSESGVTYSDASPLVQLFKTESRVRMVDVLLRKHYQPLTTRELATLADIDRSTVTRNLDVLHEIGVIEEVEQVSNARRYQINTDSQVVKALGKAQWELFEISDTVPESMDEQAQESFADDSPTNAPVTESAVKSLAVEDLLTYLDAESRHLRVESVEALVEFSEKYPRSMTNHMDELEAALEAHPELHEYIAEIIRNVSAMAPRAVSRTMLSTLLDLGMTETAADETIADIRSNTRGDR